MSNIYWTETVLLKTEDTSVIAQIISLPLQVQLQIAR